MEFSEIASLIKSIAGVAVLITVVYLALQLRSQNRIARHRPPRPFGAPSGLPGFDLSGGPEDLNRSMASLEAQLSLLERSDPKTKSEE